MRLANSSSKLSLRRFPLANLCRMRYRGRMMKNIFLLMIHFVSAVAGLFRPGGTKSILAESLLLHQLVPGELVIRQGHPSLASNASSLAPYSIATPEFEMVCKIERRAPGK